MDSPKVHLVKEVFESFREGGVEVGIERMLSQAHPDFEFRPYVAGGRVLRGPDEVRAFFREQLAAGTAITPRAASFKERGDDVVVRGSLRVERPGGGLAESQMSWTFRFREGLLEEVGWGPLEPA